MACGVVWEMAGSKVEGRDVRLEEIVEGRNRDWE